MLLKIYVTVSFWMLVLGVVACDFCNMYSNINPNDYQHSFSAVYRLRPYKGVFTEGQVHTSGTLKTQHGGTHVSNTLVEETYQSYELWGRFFISERLQLVSSIGVASNHILEDRAEVDQVTGIGDWLFMGRYQLYNSLSTDTADWVHRLLVGGGVVIPTGVYRYNNGIDPYIQPGTGSFDFLLSSTYLVKWRNIGTNVDVSYKINTKNTLGFRYANRFNISANIFYQLKMKNLAFVPRSGIYLEKASRDQKGKQLVNGSGGTIAFGDIGLDFYYKKIALNSLLQVPFLENLNDVQVPNQNRWTLGMTLFF